MLCHINYKQNKQHWWIYKWLTMMPSHGLLSNINIINSLKDKKEKGLEQSDLIAFVHVKITDL